MKLSILTPSYRQSSAAMSRVFQLADLPGDKFEFIVRDNSESPHKRQTLEGIRSSCLRHVPVPNQGAKENFAGVLALAEGDYVLFYADDDLVFPAGLESAHAALARGGDEGRAGLTFGYLITSGGNDRLFNYQDSFTSPQASERIRQYAQSMTQAPNLLFYSVLRTDVMRRLFEFLDALPYEFSHADQLLSILSLVCGKMPSIPDVVYNYDLTEWSTPTKAEAKDRFYFQQCGLDPDIQVIHPLIQAVEGYFLIASGMARNLCGEDLREAAAAWFITKLRCQPDCSKLVDASSETLRRCGRLVASLKGAPEVDPSAILAHIADIIAVGDVDGGRRFHSFWKAL